MCLFWSVCLIQALSRDFKRINPNMAYYSFVMLTDIDFNNFISFGVLSDDSQADVKR